MKAKPKPCPVSDEMLILSQGMLSSDVIATVAKKAGVSERTVRRWWNNPASVNQNNRRRLSAVVFSSRSKAAKP